MNKPKHNKRLVLYAFLFNIIFLAFCLIFFDIKYEVSDDYIVDSVLSGAFTEKGSGYYDVHLLFSNILIGYPLKLLYMMIPGISWYFVFLMALSFTSLTVMTYLIFMFLCGGEKKLSNDRYKVASAISFVFLLYFSLDLYVIPQFTKISVAATVSGGSLFVYAIWVVKKNPSKNVLPVIISVMLTLSGIMLRFQAVYISLPFLLIQFVMYASKGLNANIYMEDSEKSVASETCGIYIKHICFRLVACGALIGLAYLLNTISLMIWNSKPAYEDYRDYATLRARITDVSKEGYEEVEAALANIGFDSVDYYMITSWNFYDKDVFTDKKLEYLADVFKIKSAEETHSLDYIFDGMAKRDYASYHTFVGFFILIIMIFLIKPRGLCWHIGTIVVMFFFLGSFFWKGRVVYRVEYGIIFSATVTTIVCGLSAKRDFIDLLNENIDDNYHRRDALISRVMIAIAGMAFLMNLTLFIPDMSYKTMTDEEYRAYINTTLNPSWDYISDKYRINVNNSRPYGKLINYMENDKEGYYLLDFTSCIQLIYYDYKPWIRMPQGYFDENYMYLGGVLMRYPEENDLFIRHGMDPDNPYKDIIKDGIFVVDNRYSDIKLSYIRKYYYPNARKELVDIVDGFKIWKFYEE